MQQLLVGYLFQSLILRARFILFVPLKTTWRKEKPLKGTFRGEDCVFN